jgi:hypothetical protein
VDSNHPDGAAPPDWIQGYGYQFWRCRHGAYRGDGAFGQFCIVMPDQDAVLAITSGAPDMQAVLDRVWQHLLPAMASAPLAEDARAHEALVAHLAALRLPVQAGERTAEQAIVVDGKTFALPENESGLWAFGLELAPDGAVIAVETQLGTQRVPCGYGTWSRGELAGVHPGSSAIAACGAWTDARTFEAQICFCETPFLLHATCRFDGDRVRLRLRWNASFGPTSLPELIGYSRT